MTVGDKFLHGYAVVIGVGVDLPVTVLDAKGMARLLVAPSRCAYPEHQVKLLTEQQSTKTGILDALDWLIDATTQDVAATAIVYFSGHGGCRGDSYFLVPFGYDPSDRKGTTVDGSEFAGKLSKIAARRLVVLLDCCHAGGLASVKEPGVKAAPLPFHWQDVLATGSGRAAIASSRRDELSLTGSPYSVFTQALLEGLAGQNSADDNGYAYLADVALYVGRVVPQRTHDQQHPILMLSAADNFAMAFYAGGGKGHVPLGVTQPSAAAREPRESRARGELIRQYRRNLLIIEERMAVFIDQAAVPPDLIRAKAMILDKMLQLQAETDTQQ